MAPIISPGGTVELPPIQLGMGGRQVARGKNGVCWMPFAFQEAAGTYTVRCAFMYLGTLLKGQPPLVVVEVVATGLIKQPTGLSICVDANDDPLIAFAEQTTTNVRVYRRESEVWVAKATATSQSQAMEGFQIVVRADGIAHLFWVDFRSATGLQRLIQTKATTTSISAWSALTVVDSVSNTNQELAASRRVAVALRRDGSFAVVYWFREASTKWRMRFVQSATDGVTWGSPEFILNPDPNLGDQSKPREFTIATREYPSSEVHVAFTWPQINAIDHLGVWYLRRDGGTGLWDAPAMIHPTVPFDAALPSLNAQPYGKVQIAFQVQGLGSPSTNRQAYLAEQTTTGGAWSFLQLTAGTLDVDAVGMPHMPGPQGHDRAQRGYLVVYFDGTTRVFQFSTDLEWHLEPMVVTAIRGASSAAKAGGGATAGATSNLRIATLATFKRHRTIGVSTTLRVATRYFLPLVRSGVRISCSASLAGAVRNLAVTTRIAITTQAVAEDQLTCDTSFVPSPAIQSDELVFRRTLFIGPHEAPTRTLTLQSPKYSDRRSLDTRVVNLRTTHGQLAQFAKPFQRYQLELEFEGLSRRKVLEAEDFFGQMRGRQVRYIDHEARLWILTVVRQPVVLKPPTIEGDGSFVIVLEGVNA